MAGRRMIIVCGYKRVIQSSVDQDAGIGGDAAAVEFQLQAAVEIDPQGAIVRFTRWVLHLRASNPPITR